MKRCLAVTVFLALVVMFSGYSCGGSDDNDNNGGGPKDTEVKTDVVEVQPEVTPEVTSDIVPDVTPDVVPDVVLDVVLDVVPDVVPDIEPDVQPTGGCVGFCGDGNEAEECWCDELCFDYGDCCENICDACKDLECCATNVCEGKECGTVCGKECGTCDEGKICNDDFVCEVCEPECEGKECGDDGCGESCGTCATGTVCTSVGKCLDENATYPEACWGLKKPSSDTCGNLTYEGCCDDNGRLTFCDGGKLYCLDCANLSPSCGWNAEGPYYDCGSESGEEDPSGNNPKVCGTTTVEPTPDEPVGPTEAGEPTPELVPDVIEPTPELAE